MKQAETAGSDARDDRRHGGRGRRAVLPSVLMVAIVMIPTGALLAAPAAHAPASAPLAARAACPASRCHAIERNDHRSVGAPVVPRDLTSTLGTGIAPTGPGSDSALATENIVNGTLVPGFRNAPAGLGPSAAVYDPATKDLFVVDSLNSRVTVFSGANQTWVREIPVGSNPLAAAYDPKDGEIFVSNYGSNNVSVINDTTLNVVATVLIGQRSGYYASGPAGIVYDPVAGAVFVTSWGHFISPCCVYNLTRIDPGSSSVAATIRVGGGPESVVVDRGSGLLYVQNQYDDNVTVVNGSTDKSVSSFSSPASTFWTIGEAVDPVIPALGLLTYDGTHTNLSIMSIPSGTFVHAYPVETGAPGIGQFTYDPASGAFLVGDAGALFQVVSPSNGSVLRTVNLGGCLYGVQYDVGSSFVYASNYCTDRISTLDASTYQVASTVQTGAHPGAFLYDPSAGQLYFSDSSTGGIGIIDGTVLASHQETACGLASALALAPTLGRIFALCDSAFTGTPGIESISTATGNTVQFIRLESGGTTGADGLCYDPATGMLYVLEIGGAGFSDTVLNLTEVEPSTGALGTSIVVANFTGGTASDVTARSPLLVTGGGSTIVVTDTWDGFIFGFNASTLAREWKRTVGSTPDTLALDPASGELLVGFGASPRIDHLNPSTGALDGNFSLSALATGVAFDPLNNRLYVADEPSSGTYAFVELFNASSYAFLGSLNLSTRTGGVAFLNGSGLVAVAGSSTGAVYLLGQSMSFSTANVTPAAPVQGLPISITSVVSDGYGPYNYSYTGLPGGCVSASAAPLHCTPGVAGNISVTIHVNDRSGSTLSRTVSLSIARYPIVVAIAGAPSSGIVAINTPLNLTASVPANESAALGGGLTLVWSVAPKTGATFDRATGPAVSVTFNTAENSTVTLTASFNGTTRSASVRIEVQTASRPPTTTVTNSGSPAPISLILVGVVVAVVAVALLSRRRRGSPLPPEEPESPDAEPVEREAGTYPSMPDAGESTDPS